MRKIVKVMSGLGHCREKVAALIFHTRGADSIHYYPQISMQEKHAKATDELKIQLDRLLENLDDYEVLYKLQVAIIDKVIDCERDIKTTRKTGGNPEEFQFARFIFREFGDAIAFAYVNSHNLKQLSFTLEKGALKQDAGFICDKEGLRHELDTLKSLIEKGIPCVLCDLTNSVRYGDVLVLCFDDPYIIECKASRTKSNRITRQNQTRKNLIDFYKRDEKNMKIDDANVTVVRVEVTSQDDSYVRELNLLIEESQRSGVSSALVETGIWYHVFRAGTDIRLPKITGNPQKLLLFCLNDYKNNKEWTSYIPFVSSIQGAKNLLDFIEDNLVIFVTIGIDEVASRSGLRFEAKENNLEFPFWFYPADENAFDDVGVFAISTHYVHRVALEFRSFNTILVDAKKRLLVL